jgi:hypothetical protein
VFCLSVFVQAVVLFNGVETQVASTTTVTVSLVASTNQPPTFDQPTYSATISVGINSGSFVPSLIMIVTDPDGVRHRSSIFSLS